MSRRMTQAQWDTYLASVLDKARSRLERLEAARAGDVRFRTVKVEAYRVRAYTVGAHTRVIEDRAGLKALRAKQAKSAKRATLSVLKGGKQ